ncbi:hypothetical protein C922_05558 [Plasmodium inui San Antonio 1]|uniref:Uncharacterized protein n=1 Tax=Plasmodium inui San Antonio 1 TaxID=1237626 RepID=W7AFK5_9APIC|nr:hypothetical protein C922_05558 [Plasmodium inui San Antonio 1]EUD64061.1 hypothetical protein C922_05558 [Plasmodium inui San Antonio 1]
MKAKGHLQNHATKKHTEDTRRREHLHKKNKEQDNILYPATQKGHLHTGNHTPRDIFRIPRGRYINVK